MQKKIMLKYLINWVYSLKCGQIIFKYLNLVKKIRLESLISCINVVKEFVKIEWKYFYILVHFKYNIFIFIFIIKFNHGIGKVWCNIQYR